MFPDQEIGIGIVVKIKIANIPRNEERYREEKNTNNAPTFHL